MNINAAFQSKRWQQTTISRPEIDKFRGAITGDFDQGIFITTSSFTAEAKQVGFKRGAVPIMLIDGQRIVELMIENNIGVSRRRLSLLGIDEDFFAPE
ncbi:MAG: restriction endonuclease [Candidatus Methylomirabilales bacterium]